MSWTYTALKAADTAAGANANLATAAATLNAQTTTQTVNVPVGTLYGYLLMNGIMGTLSAWAAKNPGDTTGSLGVIQALQAMLTSPNITTVEMTDATTAATVTGMLGTLVTNKIITSAHQSAVLALASQTVPVWQPAVTVADIQIARAQP